MRLGRKEGVTYIYLMNIEILVFKEDEHFIYSLTFCTVLFSVQRRFCIV